MKNSNFYLLIKQADMDIRGNDLSPMESAKKLLEQKFWPLYKQTPCKHLVKANEKVLIYLAGSKKDCRKVIASVCIESVEPWSDKTHKSMHSLLLNNTPSFVLNLKDIEVFKTQVDIREHLDTLSFVPLNRQKWGVALMGGMRRISEGDYTLLCEKGRR